MHLYETMQKIGMRVLYHDTDSIIYVDPNPDDPAVMRPEGGDHLGVYKDEVGPGDWIVEYCSAGPKNVRRTMFKTCLNLPLFSTGIRRPRGRSAAKSGDSR